MQALASYLRGKVRSRVKEIAGVVLHSRTVMSESQPSEPGDEEHEDWEDLDEFKVFELQKEESGFSRSYFHKANKS